MIIAKKGAVYLIEMEGTTLGRIYDPTMQRLYAPFSLKEIFETGGWEPIKDGEEVPDIEALIASGGVEQIGIQKKPMFAIGNERDEFHLNVPS